MDLAPLVDLPILPVRITARALDPIELRTHAGASLRGAFGNALKQLVCVHPERKECPGCPMEARCAYPYLFEPRASASQPGIRGFEDLPRPYVIRAGLGARLVLPDDTLSWSVTLIGQAIAHLPYFALAWHSMGQRGIGSPRGRFQLGEVRALDLRGTPGELLYSRETNLLHTPRTVIGREEFLSWGAERVEHPARCKSGRVGKGSPRGAAVAPSGGFDPERGPRPDSAGPCGERRTLEIRFMTPTQIKHGGRPAAAPEFHVLWRGLQRRLSTLRLAHGGGRPEVEYGESIRRAQEVELVEWRVRELSWQRYSRRQGQRIPMGGFVGVARYAGEVAPFLPALKLGEFVGVGDNATFGQGEYRVVVPGPAGGSTAEGARRREGVRGGAGEGVRG